MVAKKIMKLTRDKHRVEFFAWSHIAGWLIAWAQTIWIICELRQIMKEIKKLPRK